jgi:hypothetical protein
VTFGDLKTFAIEAVTEPGPDYPATVGLNLAGRIRVHLGGNAFGDFTEPCCILGCVSGHFADICSAQNLWHAALSGLTAVEQFQLLDDLIYGDTAMTPLSKELGTCIFLTNQSEAFDGIKAFIVLPPGTNFIILVESSGSVQSFVVPVAYFKQASRDFADWLELQGSLLVRDDA